MADTGHSDRKQALALAILYLLVILVPFAGWGMLADWLGHARNDGSVPWLDWHAGAGALFALISTAGVYFAVRFVQAHRPMPARDLSQVPQAYRTLFENNPDTVYFLDREGRVTDINNAGCALLGRPRDAIIGRHFSAFLSPDTLKQAEANFAKVVDGQVRSNRYDGVITPEGEVVPISVSGMPVIVDGEVIGTCGVLKNLTDERHVDQALAEREERYRSLFEHHPGAIFSMDTDGYYTAVNDAVCELYGLPREEIEGRHYSEFVAQEDLRRVQTNFAAVVSGQPVHLDLTLVSGDGQRIEGHTTGIPIVLGGTVRGVHAIIYDISEQRRAKRQLQESEERYRALFEHHPDAVYTVDLEGHYTAVNDRSWKLMRLTSADDMLGRHYSEFIPAEELPRLDETFAAIAAGTPASMELTLVGADGTRFEAWVIGIPVLVEGRVVGIHGITQDISAQRRAQRELRESEERYRTIFESTMDGLIVSDPREQRIHAANPAACELLRGSAEVLRTYGLSPFVDLNDPVNRAFVEQRGRTGASHGVIRVHRLDGEIFEAEASSVIFTDSDGNSRASWVFRDVTERRRAEEQRRLADSALANTADGVLILDYEGRVVRTNKAYVEITGYREDELLGALPPAGDEDERAFMARIRETALEHGRWKGEFWARRRDGSLYPVLLSVSPVWDDYGKVTHFVAALNDISELKGYEARLEHIIHHDPVTGLANLTLVAERAEAAMVRARRHGRVMGVLQLGLDGFRAVNDSLGLTAGDELLRQVGERLCAAVRETDTVARQGADEFVVVLDDLNYLQDAAVVAGKLLDALNTPLVVGGQSVLTTASIGISGYPDDADDFQRLLRNADNAMQRAKKLGRNNYQFYAPDMAEEAGRTLQIRTSLHQALARDELRVRYQPFVDLASGRVTGFEALLRWQSTELGWVAPGEFIPIAEETGLILPIGEWVLRQSCSRLSELRAAGHEQLRVAVNLSARQFRQSDLADRVGLILEETGVSGDALELEITETVAMERNTMTHDALQALGSLGVYLALDDFGTGHSSLSYLKEFPISLLKIDKSFVDGLPGDEDDRAIAETIIGMARSLNLRVTAEGVETTDQLEALRSLGCDEAQGFLFSQALDAEDLKPLLGQQLIPASTTRSPNGRR